MAAAAAESVANFLKSSSHNLRYMGIDSLACIVRRDAAFANEHQMAVIACLEDPDETLKAKTLQLLHKMTKPGNVEVRLSIWAAAGRHEAQHLGSSRQTNSASRDWPEVGSCCMLVPAQRCQGICADVRAPPKPFAPVTLVMRSAIGWLAVQMPDAQLLLLPWADVGTDDEQ